MLQSRTPDIARVKCIRLWSASERVLDAVGGSWNDNWRRFTDQSVSTAENTISNGLSAQNVEFAGKNVDRMEQRKLGIHVRLTVEVLNYCSGYRQLSWLATQAGGPLFSSEPTHNFILTSASGPFPKDRRTRNGFIPHRASVQGEIDKKHALGQHFVGTWHTHPSKHPAASGLDIQSIGNLYRKSDHDLDLFVIVIVGTDPEPNTWEISAFGGFGRAVLTPSAPLNR